jgi:hypothetical protein
MLECLVFLVFSAGLIVLSEILIPGRNRPA